MNFSFSPLFGQLFGRLRVGGSSDPEEPIRAEMFSVERLEQHAESLAAAQTVTGKPVGGQPLTDRLLDNARVLTHAYRRLSEATRSDAPTTPAAEWLLDNFHVVEEQIREIQEHLPPQYYRELPKLAEGHLQFYPRVFGLAWAFVAHTDSRFDEPTLSRFVNAYQRVQPLTIGELWAIAITLRITLVENLRRLAEIIVKNRDLSREAATIADRLLGDGDKEPESAEKVLSPYDDVTLAPAFAAELDRRLRDQDMAIAPALRWLDDKLARAGTNSDRIIQEELKVQGALNVTVRNVITSMRQISMTDWAEFVESVSLIDRSLRAESDFASYDFRTRDIYRQAIEKLARRTKKSELDITHAALERAKRAAREMPQGKLSDRERDPGYYLIARGRPEFEREIGYRRPLSERLARRDTPQSRIYYLLIVTAATMLVMALPLWGLQEEGIAGWRWLVALALAIVPASDVALALVHRFVTGRFGPAILPSLELLQGVEPHLRTIVAMPVLLNNEAQVEKLLEQIEVHHLASGDGDLYFALLTDWRDAGSEKRAGDDELLEAAARGIAQLNDRYGPALAGPRFMLLHRKRLWNEGEGKWIGWERKRGKLHELNRLLRGADDTSFIPIDGKKPWAPPDVRYVITLDADTRLPRKAAKRLIGKMAHPLNRPRFDAKNRLVVEGHGILQPRVSPSLPVAREGSLFQRVFSSPRGLDPYAFAVSDVYQDLFQEGSYVGKGIYDVDVFESALEGRIPESSVLSHDLLEGSFARAGLVSDIEVVEEFPSEYDVAAARQHRWVRGDWQLLPWVLGYGRDPYGRRRNVLNLISRWKMVDNLRRSLAAPIDMLALLIGWTLPLDADALWTIFILATIMLPPLIPWFAGLVPRRIGISKRTHLRSLGSDLGISLVQIGFTVTFLAHQAWLMLSAVVLTLFRLFFHRRRLLEWVTAAQVSNDHHHEWRNVAWQTVESASFAIAVLALLFEAQPQSLPNAAAFLFLWTLSPIIAWWASLTPRTTGHPALTEPDAQALRLIARRTWRYFERFVTPEDHWLPPDNFQEAPAPVVARRTSPTNIGLYLLSVLSALDFGWIGESEAVERWEQTFVSLKSLEQFRGHFYNWYGTADLAALHPKYVSTVDSGNLAGNFLLLEHAARGLAQNGKRPRDRFLGVRDTILLALEALDDFVAAAKKAAPDAKHLRDALESLKTAALDDDSDFERKLARLSASARAAAGMARGLAAEKSDEGEELIVWTQAIAIAVDSHARDFAGSDSSGHDGAKPQGAAAQPALAARLSERAAAGGNGETQTLERPRANAAVNGEAALADAAESELKSRLEALADLSHAYFTAMKFDFLYESGRQLFAIGYRVEDSQLDPNCYDLLGSEARLASFIAIAKEDVPPKHWFHLGRTLTPVGRGSALISWSGSMFEYLMPSLIMRAPAGSILEQTIRLVVKRQISYGAQLGVPWGMSESQYNARDLEGTYQYSSFGVPDLGYKRNLSDNIVIAPYATALAAMIDPKAAAKNYRHLTAEGGRGVCGWYEALDYTPERIPEGAKVGIVRAYMAHHQGMSIVAIADALLATDMRDRFHAEPMIRANELLLQERMPRDIAVARPTGDRARNAIKTEEAEREIQRRYKSPHSRIPRTQLLSNGSYAVMLTSAGSGYSRWRNLDITRWHEDGTTDHWGSYVFLRDTKSGEVWSAGYQPTAVEPDSYDVSFSEGRAEFVRQDGLLKTTLEVAVSAEHDAEVRQISIANLGGRAREIELTSYAELVLVPHAEDTAHPAFAKLFVETEFVPEANALLATRRKKSPSDRDVWVAHFFTGDASTDSLQFETDRERFLGRGFRIRSPSAIAEGWPLSNSQGAVLDPIFSLRARVQVEKGATMRVAFWTLVAGSREEALELVEKHREASAFERVNTLAWTQAQGQFHHLGIGPEEANLFQRLANRVLYSDPSLRPPQDVLRRGGRPLSTLWQQGVSGDFPIVLARIDDIEDIDFVRQLLRAYEYWRLKRLAVDLVILNERASSYLQDLQNAIDTYIRPLQSRPKPGPDDVQGSVFVLRGDLISPEIRNLLQTVARVVLFCRRGTLAEQLSRVEETRQPIVIPPATPHASQAVGSPGKPPPKLEFFNGLGGFDDDGREYVTLVRDGKTTPAPWINIIANPNFGFQVSTDGASCTWALNSQQNRLTPWSNDPVSDPTGEAIFIRDADSAELWCPTPLPIRDANASYVVRHGRGYSRFEHESRGLKLDLLHYVAPDDPIKISRLKISNQTRRARNLSVTGYVEWVLSATRGVSASTIVTEIDPETGAMFARQPLSNDFSARIAFVDFDGRQTSWTGDRAEFLGRNGALSHPLGLLRGTPLSNRTGAALDPCGALQTQFRLAAGGSIDLVFTLGEAGSASEAQSLIAKYRTADLNRVFDEAKTLWAGTMDKVQVKTPDCALDILMNRWLPYQTLSARVWARSGFYQSSGAYGFRDQLQDVGALRALRPDIAREHLLRAASRQFVEGDTQHWWLPESGRGVRTLVCDDRIWLPFIALHYLETTGDNSLLDESVAFLEGPLLQKGETDNFFQPPVSPVKASFFEHCARALDGALETGAHALPLMGTGDWNDGMNRVGIEGKGESVWMGWFLNATLLPFAKIADARGEHQRAEAWRAHAKLLAQALEEAWDGDWYRRAYFDDGTPLGSVASSECRIDSIAQSWSVISGAGDRARSLRAMAAVEKYLVRRDEGLVLLFTPPFDKAVPDPGYIKGYPPGIRENGGQYTHAALWVALAYAMLGKGDEAYDLLTLLNPIHKSASTATMHRYRVEPYVMAADVYGVAPHIGRGGWTWYTGSSGWMYRATVEGLLGLKLRGNVFAVDPCIPKAWPGFELTLRRGTATTYKVTVENPNHVNRGVVKVELDGKVLEQPKAEADAPLQTPPPRIPFNDDGAVHIVRVVLG